MSESMLFKVGVGKRDYYTVIMHIQNNSTQILTKTELELLKTWTS